MEGGDAEAAEPGLRTCTGAAYGSSGEKVERIARVESVDTIMDAAQTRFFARAVADPAAISDLWPASMYHHHGLVRHQIEEAKAEERKEPNGLRFYPLKKFGAGARTAEELAYELQRGPSKVRGSSRKCDADPKFPQDRILICRSIGSESSASKMLRKILTSFFRAREYLEVVVQGVKVPGGFTPLRHMNDGWRSLTQG